MEKSEPQRSTEEGKQGVEEAIEGIKETQKELEKHRPDLIINKVPKGELKIFKELARGEFSGDYGMTLKFLTMSFYEDVRYNDCLIRLQNLEQAYDEFINSKEPNNIIRSLDGTIIGDKK